jgi:hypothetical protein
MKKALLGINLINEVKENLYNENCKTLKKEIVRKKTHKKWKDLPCSWVGRVNILIILKL